MAYDEALAARVEALLDGEPGRRETKRMFGGVAMMLDGNLAVAVLGQGLLVRIDRAGTESALAEPGTKPFDMGGRTGRGWVVVEPETLDGDSLGHWVARGVGYARTLPPK